MTQVIRPRRIGLLLSSLFLLAACNAQINTPPLGTDPNDTDPTPSPSATPTPSASPTAMPSPSPTPGWSSVTVTVQASAYAYFMAEIRRLQAQGLVTGVTELANFQVRFNASAATVSYLQSISGVQFISFNTLFQSSLNIRASFNKTISTGEEFVSFWRQYVSQLDAIPNVDFSSSTVLAIFPGPRPLIGYTTSVLDIKLLNRQLKVRYKVKAPTVAPSPANFTPVHIVVIPLSKLRSQFDTVVYEEVPDCSRESIRYKETNGKLEYRYECLS